MGGKKQPSNTTTTATPWEPQGEELKNLFAHARSFYDRGGVAPYTGPRVADQNQNQLNAQQDLLTNADTQDTQALNARTSAGQLLGASDVGNNPIVQDAVQAALNPVRRQFTEQVLPTLNLGASDAGQVGSSRQGVLQARALDNFQQNENDLVARMMGDFYGQGLDAQSRALNLMPALQAMTNTGAITRAGVGDAQQAYEQTLLDSQIQEYLDKANAPLQNLTNYRNLITGEFGGTTTGPSGVQGPSRFGSALGGGLSGYAMASMAGMANPALFGLAMGGASLF